MKSAASTTFRLDSLVAEAADRFTDEIKEGLSPSIEAYAERFPEIADVIRNIFPALAVLDGNALTSPTDARADGPVTGVLGDFRILRELGRGGMGVVYEAEQISLSRRVALKVLPFAAVLDKQQLARFKNEARAAATLDHPNIVGIYSVGCERGVHYYAMQLIEGQSLAQVVDQLRSKFVVSRQSSENPPPRYSGEGLGEGSLGDTAPVAALSTLPDCDSPEYFRTVARLGIQAAEALDQAHQNGILHRDIKPANLLVEYSGVGNNSLKLWVTDFGLARIEQDAGMTMTGDLLGTLRYMSPEQALGQRAVVDHRSDVYSLGVTLYELLTLRPAFPGEDRPELLRQIALEEPRKPRQINALTPRDLETIVLKAIEKSASDRYATAKELADDLGRFVANEPIKAKATSHIALVVKLVKRHPAVMWSAAVILFAATIVSGLSAFLINSAYQRESVERQKAETNEQQAHANARRAEEISNFLVRAFQSPDPSRDGSSVTVAEILQRAEKNLTQTMADQPTTKAYLLGTIGRSQLGLGLHKDALLSLTHAAELYERTLGPDHPDTLRSMTDLARVYTATDRRFDAIALYEQTLSLQRATLGTAHPDTLSTIASLSGVLSTVNRTGDAIVLLEEALETAGDQAAYDFPDQIAAKLASAYIWAGRSVDAIPLYERAWKYRARTLGVDHPNTLVAMNGLGYAYYKAGRSDQAIPIYEQTLAARREKLGPSHIDTLTSINNLAAAYRDAGRLDDAIPLFETALTARRERLGPVHIETVISIDNLATAYQKTGQADKAISLREQALVAARHRSGPDNIVASRMTDALANAYYLAGRVEDARLVYDEAVDMMQRTDPLSLNAFAWTFATSPRTEFRNGRWAVEFATKAAELTDHKDPSYLDTLAAAYAENGDFDAAIRWVNKAIELADDDNDEELQEHRKSYQDRQPWRQ